MCKVEFKSNKWKRIALPNRYVLTWNEGREGRVFDVRLYVFKSLRARAKRKESPA